MGGQTTYSNPTNALWQYTPVATGIESVKPTAEVKVFPNPFAKTITVYNPVLGELAEINMYDVTGKLVFKQLCSGSVNMLQLPVALPAGNYLLQMVKNGKPFYSQTVVKE